MPESFAEYAKRLRGQMDSPCLNPSCDDARCWDCPGCARHADFEPFEAVPLLLAMVDLLAREARGAFDYPVTTSDDMKDRAFARAREAVTK